MLTALNLRRNACLTRTLKSPCHYSRSNATRSFDPLRILLCGSDIFSIASLNALHGASQQDRTFVESIHVVSRPGKWTGPGKKVYKEVPIAERARSLNLPLHQIDTFRGWTPPANAAANLIIAVSFGLLIPRRIIESARYGGVNVHPSLLPDLWGAAPLQHTLLDDDSHTGITVQTLHPTTMDKGAILAQTAAPGLEIPKHRRESFQSLTEYMAPRGADLLLQALRQGLFVSPITDLSPQAASLLRGQKPRHASKLGIEDRHIDWRSWPAEKILRYQKLLGTLWNTIDTNTKTDAGAGAGTVKIVWSGAFEDQGETESKAEVVPGLAYLGRGKGGLLLDAVDGKTLRVDRCTVAGESERRVEMVASKHGLIDGHEDGSRRVFKNPFK